MWAALAAAAVMIVFLLWRVLSFKAQMREMTREIRKTRAAGYDRQIRVQLSDRDMTELAAEMNRTIDRQKELKKEAETAERSIRRAMSDIAHDLRTPLAVIKGDLQLIGRSGELSEENGRYLSVCLEKTERLKEMTDSFFELALLETDSSRVPLKRLDLTAFIMEFLAENEGRIRLAEIEPEVVFPPKTVFVMADKELLGRMMDNLLGNVLKYSSGDLRITLDESGVLFENRITGELPDPTQIFERSYRAERSRGSGGAGLGLYIVKLLAEKQDAAVSAALDGDRLGVRADFLLPNK